MNLLILIQCFCFGYVIQGLLTDLKFLQTSQSEKSEDTLIAPVAPFVPTSESVVETIKADETEICSLDKDGKPPRPRMILLGETGVGKSTFGNRLFKGEMKIFWIILIKLNKGYSEDYDEEYDYYNEEKEEEVSNDHIVKEGSYLEKTKNKNFGVGHTMESHTNETVWKTGNKCFTGLYM